MLKISRMSDYAIVLLTAMAKLASEQQTARALSDQTGLTLPTVGKLLKMLAANELLCSQQGRHGGYRLARPADKISLADIIESIDGPIAMTECFTIEHDCEREADCGLKPHWKAINDGVRQLLDHTTLAELIEPIPQVPVWFDRRTPTATSATIRESGSDKSRQVGAAH